MNCRGAGGMKIISVGASSKKAGKSSLASFLVKELGADYGLKVSSGGHSQEGPVTTDPAVISRAGTDTGSLVRAGASKVVWVNADPPGLERELKKAMKEFPPGGLLVVEGNSAVEYLEPDLSVFLMAVPFEEFKPSGRKALAGSDLVLVDMREGLSGADGESIERGIRDTCGEIEIIFFGNEEERRSAWSRAAEIAEGVITQ